MHIHISLANDTDGLLWKWIPLKPKGSRPPPRSGVSIATSANGSSAYTFGGVVDAEEDEEVLEGHFSNDLLMLDLANQKWWPVNLKTQTGSDTEPRNPNVGPSPRMKAGLAISKGILYLYGGQVEQKNKQYTLGDLYSLGM